MSAPLKAIDGNADLAAQMTDLASRARAAARQLALAPAEQKNRALDAMEQAIRANAAAILKANAEDVAEARASGATSAFVDRLTLTEARVAAMADGIRTVRDIPDPVGAVTESWQRPNGMTIERVRVPLGVIAVIFESRPNVCADAGVLCLKSGNAVIQRGGSDSFRSCRAIHDCLVQGLREANLPEAAISLVPTRDRAAVGLCLHLCGIASGSADRICLGAGGGEFGFIGRDGGVSLGLQTAGFFDYGVHWGLVAFTIAMALTAIVTFGSLAGSMLPFALKKCGLDPASASAPFVATLVDVTGLVIYFTVALVFLSGTLL